jgi:metal-responsive CopG/Arc/MetJ family transcriptional regulator
MSFYCQVIYLNFFTHRVEDKIMPPKMQFSIRLPHELVKELDQLAEERVRDRTSMIEYILTLYVKKHRPKSNQKDDHSHQ